MQPQTPQPTQPTPPTPPTTPPQPAAPAQPMTPPQPAQPFASAQPVSPAQPTSPQTPPQTPAKPKSNKLTIILLVVFLVILIGGIAAYFLLANANQSTKTSDSGTVVSPEVVDDETEGGNNNTEDGTKTDDVLSADTINLEDFVIMTGCNGDNIFDGGLSEDYKYLATMKKSNYEARIVDEVEEENTMGVDMVTLFDLTYDELNNIYHQLFGSGKDLTQKYSYSEYCGLPWYSEKYNSYIRTGGCGCATPVQYSYEEISREAEGSEATVRVKYNITNDAEGTSSTTLYDLIFTLEDDHYVLTGLKAVI